LREKPLVCNAIQSLPAWGIYLNFLAGRFALKSSEPASGGRAGYRINAFAVNGMLQTVELFFGFLESKGETGDRFQWTPGTLQRGEVEQGVFRFTG